MLFGLFSRRQRRPNARVLYGAIVAQSRRPAFYQAGRVPDTVEGRFDLIVLHQALFVLRLARDGDRVRALGQDVFDMFCADMDDNLREMGVGDLAVPKRMRAFAEAYYGRLAAYGEALASGDDAALEAALARNVLGEVPGAGGPGEAARPLAAYVRKAVACLDGQDAAAFAAGRLVFPDPEAAGMMRGGGSSQ